jgi:hypothetical protein
MRNAVAFAAALRQAEAALETDPRGHLLLPQRRTIWAALGSPDMAGRRARARLAMTATQRVLPIWQQLWPSNRLPHHLLELAERVCRGELEGATLREVRDQAETELDDLSWAARDAPGIAVGYAAHRALGVAIRDEIFDPAAPDSMALDEDSEPHTRDSAFLASIAVADGPPWAQNSSAERRRLYWHWWLKEAVPEVARMI